MKWCGLATSSRTSALGCNRGKGRVDSAPVRLRDRFTGRKRPQGTDRPRPENQNKTQNINENTNHHCLLENLLRLEPRSALHHGKIQSGLRRSRYHQKPVIPRGDDRKERAEPFPLCGGRWTHAADVNGDEVEAYLLKAGLVQLTAAADDTPTDRSCDEHHHE